MKKTITTLLIVLCASVVSAQEIETTAVDMLEQPSKSKAVITSDDNVGIVYENTYAAKTNAFYWKNRKPHAAYWQQDVWYTINAELDDEKETISGSELLVYTNNSSDELKELYFHLYQNAFQPGSYYSQLGEANKIKYKYGVYEGQKLGTTIENLKVDGQEVVYSVDNTIVKVTLKTPLKPNASLEISMNFTTYFDNKGTMRRRMKTFEHDGVKQFDGVHWYPRISVYDHKFGWTTDQHLGKEFYGNFGQFDVNLTIPNNYIMEATGVLVNEKEVLPDDLKKAIDISNYATKDGVPSLYAFDLKKTGKKTWVYNAINVHDFAFTCDPSYRRMVTLITEPANPFGKIECIALVQAQHAHAWQPTSAFVAEVVKTYNRDFGVYLYNKIVAADARDGMEYPMITLNGGSWPGHQYLIAHEVGHNWFFGHVGNNETYRASLDEGFTQFLTSWSIKNFRKDNTSPNETDYQTVFRGYLGDAQQFEHSCLNTHSDDFESALGHGGGYRQVYYKTATMLYNLQYVLGDELFLKAMQHYFAQWRLAHPYFEDFRNSIINYTQVDLNWFFDQWLETEKELDYKIVKVKSKKSNANNADFYNNEVTIKRTGQMIMPLDIKVSFDKAAAEHYILPVSNFAKTESGTKVLPKWTGWGNLNKKHTIYFTSDKKLTQVEIDPTKRLADYNPNDNVWKKEALWYIDKGNYASSDLRKVQIGLRPDVWYNTVDGIKIGAIAERSYGKLNNTKLMGWYSTGIGGYADNPAENAQYFQYQLNHNRKLGRKADWNLQLRNREGLQFYSSEVSRMFGLYKLSARAKAMNRAFRFSSLYAPVSQNWGTNAWNNSIQLQMNKSYNYFNGNGEIVLHTKNSALFSDYNFAEIGLELKNNYSLGSFPVKTRIYGVYQTGNNIPLESRIFLAGANPEEMMDNKFTSAAVLWDQTPFGNDFGQFQWLGGGLNVRGMANYLAPVKDGNILVTPLFSGVRGTSVSAEIEFDHLVKFKPKWFKDWLHIDAYGFADAALIGGLGQNNTMIGSALSANAGIGTAYTFKSWGRKMDKAKPFVFRVDFPFFVNRLPAVNTGDYFDFRVVFGINRCF